MGVSLKGIQMSEEVKEPVPAAATTPVAATTVVENVVSNAPAESKLEKFTRLATKRFNDPTYGVKHSLKLLQNLGSPAYEVDPVLANTLVNELAAQIEVLKVRWGIIKVEKPKRVKKEKEAVKHMPVELPEEKDALVESVEVETAE